MSLDRRLRDAFNRAASTVDPNVELHLERTLGRSSRLHRLSVVGTAMAASAATVALIVAIQVFGTPSGGTGGPAESPFASPAASGSVAAVAGTYTATLLESDLGVPASDLALAGTWSMTLEPSGTIELVPPASFEGSRAAGHTFSLDGSELRTDLYYNDYCGSIGTYSWEATGEGLVLTVVDDECEIRRTLLATREWMRAE